MLHSTRRLLFTAATRVAVPGSLAVTTAAFLLSSSSSTPNEQNTAEQTLYWVTQTLLPFSSSSIAYADASSGTGVARPTFEPCPEVACKGKDDILAMFGDRSGSGRPLRRFNSNTTSSSSSSSSSRNTSTSSSSSPFSSASTSVSAVPSSVTPILECPPLREELGYHSWNLLHTMAAYYPDNPTQEEKDAAQGLITSIAKLYPCKHCRASFAVDIQELPPQLENRTEFSLWMCKQHNRVNASLGKTQFACEMGSLDRRWRTGDPACWGGGGTDSSDKNNNTTKPQQQGQTAMESLGQVPDEDE